MHFGCGPASRICKARSLCSAGTSECVTLIQTAGCCIRCRRNRVYQTKVTTAPRWFGFLSVPRKRVSSSRCRGCAPPLSRSASQHSPFETDTVVRRMAAPAGCEEPPGKEEAQAVPNQGHSQCATACGTTHLSLPTIFSAASVRCARFAAHFVCQERQCLINKLDFVRHNNVSVY